MRKRSALGIAVLVGVLILASVAPASAAPRLRLYRGETSQGEVMRFVVARTDDGRFVRRFDLSAALACEDQTTIGFGITSFLARTEVPVTDGAFSYDVNYGDLAIHLAGHLGPLQGEGTASLVHATLTSDEQAQLCTTGDLTWTVEFIRRL
jgi:hypothetical protein